MKMFVVWQLPACVLALMGFSFLAVSAEGGLSLPVAAVLALVSFSASFFLSSRAQA